MKILNQHNKYICDKKERELIERMITHGYGSVTIGDMKATYNDTYEVDGERYILVDVSKQGEDDERD